MLELEGRNPITEDGEYSIPVNPGGGYIFTLKGDFASGTVVMAVLSDVDKTTFDDVDGGSWTAATEDTLIPSGSVVRLTLSGSTTPSIRVSLIPID